MQVHYNVKISLNCLPTETIFYIYAGPLEWIESYCCEQLWGLYCNKMQSPLISWFIAFFMAVAASTQGSPDKCVAAVKSLEATVDKRLQKLEADVRAIYLGLNPQGRIVTIIFSIGLTDWE